MGKHAVSVPEVFLQNINEICKPLLPGFCINKLEWNKKISCTYVGFKQTMRITYWVPMKLRPNIKAPSSLRSRGSKPRQTRCRELMWLCIFKIVYPLGAPILPNLLRYQLLAVKYYSCALDALYLWQTRRLQNPGKTYL
jgi:hypothetical protein